MVVAVEQKVNDGAVGKNPSKCIELRDCYQSILSCMHVVQIDLFFGAELAQYGNRCRIQTIIVHLQCKGWGTAKWAGAMTPIGRCSLEDIHGYRRNNFARKDVDAKF
jgi:hypothetical protein